MNSLFTIDFFRQNRERLRTLFTGTAPIVLTAHGLLQRNGDVSYKFRQDSSFWYLTGITDPDIMLVMDKGREYLILSNDREPSKIAFDGQLNPEELTRLSGIEEIYDQKTGWKKLEARLKKVQHIATLAAAPVFVEWHDMYTNPARARLIAGLKEIAPEAELLDLRPHLLRMRSIKQPVELEAIQRAIDITVDTFKSVERKLGKYQHEYQIEADLTQGFRRRGALGHSFDPIVASGKNTCILHYYRNNAPLAGQRMLYLDIGAEYEWYAADIARTYFLVEPSKRERQVYAAVAEAHAFGLELVRPGVSIRENEKKMEQFIGEKLRELGLIKLIERDEVRKYYPHALSHYLGMDPHDIGDYDQPLEPGMVLTVEPGIYIPEEGIGVRIEDDLLVTETGLENLSRKLPIQFM
ncbi:MAG TPA: Xaa-Pro aminopeptidase [Candidatus Limnocylindria bacterium]|nr:Xaa-Pro aminopeptidase [Candidatus Limnocylindria bacterium]